MPTPTIPAGNLYMNATLLTGTAATQVITNGVAGQSFQPDMVWLKSRTNVNNHTLYDSIRGVNKVLYPNLTNLEATGSEQLTAFNSNGFTLGASENANDQFGETSVGWQWKAGGAAVANTAGSIASQVSVNANSGFSIVTYTATAADPITVGHGLGVVPSMFMVKSRSAAGTDWFVYHSSLGATKNLRLNDYAAAATATNVWNDTAPTSNVITTSNAINTNGVTYVAYCWTPIAGYSAFGSYTGNGVVDGPFVYLGFRPRWIMIKNTTFAGTTTSNWFIRDTTRDTYNVANKHLWADLAVTESNASYASSVYENLDILSNGFKLRNDNGGTNRSGDTFIYMAFAENPFKYANAR